MRSTHAGAALTERLKGIIEHVGPYPHAALSAQLAMGKEDEGDVTSSGPKKQGTRLVKIVCRKCGYTCRTTKVESTWDFRRAAAAKR